MVPPTSGASEAGADAAPGADAVLVWTPGTVGLVGAGRTGRCRWDCRRAADSEGGATGVVLIGVDAARGGPALGAAALVTWGD